MQIIELESVVKSKILGQMLFLNMLLNKKKAILKAHLVNPVAADGVLSLISIQNSHF